jgi:D-sedoheptulose 7-phosphate isomerase
MTAIANDHSYKEVFSRQLEYYDADDDAVAIVLSVSGSSPNIVCALENARSLGYTTIALVGKDGGPVLKDQLADHILHFPSFGYGVVEDCFSICMHSLSGYIWVSETA